MDSNQHVPLPMVQSVPSFREHSLSLTYHRIVVNNMVVVMLNSRYDQFHVIENHQREGCPLEEVLFRKDLQRFSTFIDGLGFNWKIGKG